MKVLTDVTILGVPTQLTVGTNLSVTGNSAASVGTNNTVSGQYSTAVGENNTVASRSGFAAGNGNELTSNANNCVALCNTNYIDAVDSVAIGNNNLVLDLDGIAIGQSNTIEGDNSIIIGSDSDIGTSGTSCMALGYFVEANALNAIVIGKGPSSSFKLVNSTASTLMMGFNSTSPTFTLTAGPLVNTPGTITMSGPVNIGDRIQVAEITAPSTPGAGLGYLYAKSDGKLYFLNDGATEYDLTGGGGSPGGSNTQVQFNNSGSFGGDAGLTYNSGTDVLTVVGGVVSPSVTTATTELVLSQSGDGFGTTSLSIRNRGGANGALFTNAGVDLVDFGFVPSSGYQSNLRYEHRSEQIKGGTDNTVGEFQFFDNAVGTFTQFFTTNKNATVIRAGSLGVGIDNPPAKFSVISSTEQVRLMYDISTYMTFTMTSGGVATFNTVGGSQEFSFEKAVNVPDEAYGVGWNGNTEVPTKNAVYDKIESLVAGSGGITRSVNVTSGSATMGSTANTDYVYFVAGAHTMSLPAASGNTNRYTVKNNHSANITVDTVGAENVEGASSISIASEESVDFMSDGTNWYVI